MSHAPYHQISAPVPGLAPAPTRGAVGQVGENPKKRGHWGQLPHVQEISPEDPATLCRAQGLGEAGARFVLTKPRDLPMTPVRVYAALGAAPTPEARVELAMQELERQGAFRRANIFVGVATGGGHVNPVTLELVERMAKGNIASVAIQYGTRPSILSVDKVDDARDLTAMLLTRIRDRIRREHPNGGGPRVLLYGESLGGWASQNALERAAEQQERATGQQTDPLRALGVDRAAWIGVPGFSRFKGDRLGAGGMQALNAVDDLARLAPGDATRARAWDYSHLDDPVHRADLSLFWKRPAWLSKDGPNPHGVDPNEHFQPIMTALRTAWSAIRSAGSERPGIHLDDGHDYRGALPRLLRAAYGFSGVSDADLALMTEQTRQSELWIMRQKWT
jgi:hypothetical protein